MPTKSKPKHFDHLPRQPMYFLTGNQVSLYQIIPIHIRDYKQQQKLRFHQYFYPTLYKRSDYCNTSSAAITVVIVSVLILHQGVQIIAVVCEDQMYFPSLKVCPPKAQAFYNSSSCQDVWDLALELVCFVGCITAGLESNRGVVV